MFKRLLISLTILFALNVSVSAQAGELSAVIEVIGENIVFIRANTTTELSLSVEAIAPFGIGDRIRTGQNGRILITIDEQNRLLVLPNSEYQINDFRQDDAGVISLSAEQIGTVVHDFANSDLNYTLETEQFSITQADGHFLVWNVPDGLRAVTSATGNITLIANDIEQQLTANTGFSLRGDDTVVSITSPLHASQVDALSVGCQGVVNTSGSLGLRLRAGAALDYQIVDVLQDGQSVQIAGTTENGMWYRLPFQTGFGWLFSNLIDATCTDLPVFPNLFREIPERITDALPVEVELLAPFYGTPETNLVFYR